MLYHLGYGGSRPGFLMWSLLLGFGWHRKYSNIIGGHTKKMASGNTQTQKYQRSWKTTLFAILASQGFGLMFGAALFGYVVTSQPPSIYPVFGYGKPPPILIEGLSSYHWAIVGAVIGFIFLFLALRSRKMDIQASMRWWGWGLRWSNSMIDDLNRSYWAFPMFILKG